LVLEGCRIDEESLKQFLARIGGCDLPQPEKAAESAQTSSRHERWGNLRPLANGRANSTAVSG